MNKTPTSRDEKETKHQHIGIKEQKTTKNNKKHPSKHPKLKNFKGKEHTFSRAEQSQGGKTMTPYRLKLLKLSRIKKCTKKCPIYPCRYHPLSKVKYDGGCALNKLEPSTRRKYVNLLLGGEDELFTEATNAVMTIDDGYKTVSAVEKIHKMRFGSKVTNEVVNSGGFFDELRSKVKELKKVEVVEEEK